MRNYIGKKGVLKSAAFQLLLIFQSLTLWKKRASKRPRWPGSRLVGRSSTALRGASAGTPVHARQSTKILKEIAYLAVEIDVLLPQLFDLADRVNDRRMMFSAEAPADFRQRGARQRLA